MDKSAHWRLALARYNCLMSMKTVLLPFLKSADSLMKSPSNQNRRGKAADENLSIDRAYNLLMEDMKCFSPALSRLFERYRKESPTFARENMEIMAKTLNFQGNKFGELVELFLPLLRDAAKKNPQPEAEGGIKDQLKIQINLINPDHPQIFLNLYGNWRSRSRCPVHYYVISNRGNLIIKKSGLDLTDTCALLAKTEDAMPYRKDASIRRGLQSRLVERIYLAIPRDIGGFGNIINAAIRNYNILEIYGTSRQEKLEIVAEYIKAERSKRERMVNSGKFCYRLGDDRKFTNESGPQNIRNLFKAGNPEGYQAFQLKSCSEANGDNAYLLIRQDQALVACSLKEIVWGDSKLIQEHRGTIVSGEGYVQLITGKDTTIRLPSEWRSVN